MFGIIIFFIFYVVYLLHVEDKTHYAGGILMPVFRDDNKKIQWGKMIEHYLIRLPFMLVLTLVAVLFFIAL